MATRQIYRGNPESKQYTLFNNFSGGINTTTVDELVMTNEFRHLENVELIEQGKIQKRKGFAPYELLNTWLEEKEVSTLAIKEFSTIELIQNNQVTPTEVTEIYNVNENYYTKLLYDSNNIFIKIREYDTLEDFFTAYNNVTYNAIILLVTKTSKQTPYSSTTYPSGDFVTFSYLRFYNIPNTTGASHQAEHVLLSNIFLGNVAIDLGLKKKQAPITGLNTVTFEDKVYINLHDIIEGLESTDVQYAVVSTPYNDDNILNILPTVKLVSHTNNNYEPTPYEVSFVGFNIFSQQPLTFISQDTTGLEEVRGLFITDIIDSSIVYSKIPESGQFKLHIITKGTLPSLPIIRLYTEDSLFEQIDLDTELTLFSNQNSLLVYDVKTRIENNRQIFIEVKRQEQANLNFEKSFGTTTDMINWYKNTNKTFLTLYSGQDIYSYYEPLAAKTYNYQHKLLPAYSTHVTAKTAVTLPAVDIYLQSNYPVVRTSSPLQTSFIDKNVHVLFRRFNFASGGTPVEYYIGVGGFDNTGKFKTSTFDWNDYFQTTTKFPYIELNINTFVENFSLQILNIDKISRVGSPPHTFYRWNEGEAGTIADFTVLPDDEVLVDIYNFTNFYNIGIEQNPRKVEGITFKDKSMIVFQNRLLIYSDNTIILSDPYKFNYFPNYNFITLAIDTDDKIQKIAYFRGSHMILTKKRIYRMSGTFGQNDFAIILVNDSIGCVAPDSVRGMNNNLIFLGEDGLYHIKQSFYQEGLENVDKVDKNILGLIPYGENYDSFLYNEQYMLLIKDINGNYVKTIKQYYNMEYARKAFPYVVDTYTLENTHLKKLHLFTLGIDMVSIKDGVFYLYDEGYTDFGQTYQMIIETPNYMLGYPTHDKKFKNMFIKSKSTVKHPVYITVYLEDNEVISPYEWVTNTDGIEGEIAYLKKDIASLTSGGTTYIVGGSENEVISTDNVGDIDYESETTTTSIIDENLKFNIGQDYLGGKETIIHKFVLSQKGKYIAFKITQDYNGPIAFQDFGILFKLGKVKEG